MGGTPESPTRILLSISATELPLPKQEKMPRGSRAPDQGPGREIGVSNFCCRKGAKDLGSRGWERRASPRGEMALHQGGASGFSELRGADGCPQPTAKEVSFRPADPGLV